MNVELYIDQLDNQKHKKLMLEAHKLLTELLPEIEFGIKWNTPFYILGKNFCYLNTYKNQIYFGFMQAHLYWDIPKLIFDKKLIAKYYVDSLENLHSDSCIELILSCADAFINESKQRKNKSY